MRNTKKGLTLAELLLSAAILAVVVCGLLALFATCIFLNDSNRNTTLAIDHAQYIMEDIKNNLMSLGDIDALKTLIDNGNWDLANADVAATFGAAISNESIDASATGTTSLDTLVTVSWDDRRGRSRSFSLETLFTDP